MTDRCDTEPHYFLIVPDGRPYFACLAARENTPLINELRRDGARRRGAKLVYAYGNRAAALYDELLLAWPKPWRSDSGPGYLFISPIDDEQRLDEQREEAA